MAENPFVWNDDEINFLLGSSADLLWRLDSELNLVELRSLEPLVHGYRSEELIGRPVSLFMSGRSLKKMAEVHALRMEREAKGEPTSTAWLEVEVIRKSGETVWCEVRSTPLRDGEGKISGYLGVMRETTARKEIEAQLRESEARYRTLYNRAIEQEELYRSLLNSIPHPVVLYTLEGETASINPAFTEVFGFTLEEVAGRKMPFVPKGEVARSLAEIERVLAGRPSVGFETKRYSKDGGLLDILLSSSVYRYHQGNQAVIVVILQDVTAKKFEEQRLVASEQKFSDIFLRAPMLITLTDPDDGGFVDANEKFCEISGHSKNDLKGRTSVGLGWLQPEDRSRVMEKLRGDGHFRDEEIIATAKDGRKVHCLYSGQLIHIDGARKLLAMAIDITEKKTLEAELDKAQRLEALGVLAGGLAHDFNNILTGILGSVSLARELVETPGPVSVCLDQCEKASLRASQLVAQLMTFAKGGEPVKKPTSLPGFLNESLSFSLRGSPVKGEVLVDDDLWSLEADESQLNQTMNNLLINAVQAMPEGGCVKVCARNRQLDGINRFSLPAGEYVAVSVTDTGPGIPGEYLERIFDPYFSTKERGTGLGLSTVYSIVKRHGGAIGVESAPGAGASFTFLLPASKERGAPVVPPVDQVVRKGGGRILVMDDDPDIRELAQLMLVSLDYEVEVAGDGEEAIRMVSLAQDGGEPYDAAILDLTVIGGMGGKEAAARLSEVAPSLRLIASSGYSNSPVMAECARYGFSLAIPKPYNLAALSAGVAEALNDSRHT